MVGRIKGGSEGAAKVAAKAGKSHLCGADRCVLEFKHRTNDKECPQPTVQTSIIDKLAHAAFGRTPAALRARRSLATLAFDPRARPHYARVRLKSESSLSLSIMWEQIGSIPTLDPSAYAHLCFTWLHFTARPLIYKHISQFNYTSKRCTIIALCYIILLLLSIYISFHL